MSNLRLTVVATALTLAYAAPTHAATGFDVSGSVQTENLNVGTYDETNYDATVTRTAVGSTTTQRQVVVAPTNTATGSISTYRDVTTTYSYPTTDRYSLTATFTTPTPGYASVLYAGVIESFSAGTYTLDVSAALVGEYGSSGSTTYTPSLLFSLNGDDMHPFSTVTQSLQAGGSAYTLSGTSYSFNLVAGDTLSFLISADTDAAGKSTISSLDVNVNGSIASTRTTVETTSTLIDTQTIPAVPEPEMYTLGGLAFGLVALARRRERRIAA